MFRQAPADKKNDQKPHGFFAEQSVNDPFFKPAIQPKLSNNRPDDIFERQANEIADIIASPAKSNFFFKPSVTPVQLAGGTVVQRAPVTGIKNTNSSYDLDPNSATPKQIKSNRRAVSLPGTQMTYDDSASTFSITFPLVWIFPHGWADAKRDDYVQGFEKSVRDTWNDRFVLNEQGTSRKAHINLLFDETIIHQKPNANDETNELIQITHSKPAWTMDARVTWVQDNVNGSTVNLDENANKTQTRKGSEVARGASLVVHDGTENQTFTQNTSAHEFGHMIGLGDEYLDDTNTPVNQVSAARAHINDRIMNVGNRVTPDVYQPFADWLSGLTGTTWTVGNKVR